MLRIAFFVGFAVVAAATAEPPAAATELVQGFEPSETWTEEDFKSKEMSRLFTGGTCRCDSFRGNCESRGSFLGRNGCRKGYQPTCGNVLGICYCLCKPVPACSANGIVRAGEDCLCGSSGEETGQICKEGSTCTEFDTIGDCQLKEGALGARYGFIDLSDGAPPGHNYNYNPYNTDTCDDGNTNCGHLASNGGCENTFGIQWKYEYGQVYCKKSCGLCGFDPPGARYHHYNPYNTAPLHGHGAVVLAACKAGTVTRSCLCGNEDCNPGDECFFPVKNRGFCVRVGGPNVRVGNCADEYDSCGWWASAGGCQNDPEYMRKHCKESCDLCGFDPPAAAGFGPPGTKDTCDDLNRHCGRWATTGGSTGEGTCEDPDPINYMQEHCKKSCGLCGFDPPVGFGPGAKVCAHNEPVTEDCFCERPVGGEYCEAGGFCAAGTCYRK